ncbi:MAG: hypothetical protein ACHQX3_00290 [Nitrospirales bacterium]
MTNLAVEMPERIAALERDARGYPVPYIVLHDKEGRPMFTANDLRKVEVAYQNGLCHICGQALDPQPWFVGGPGSYWLNGEKAVYFDGPMHQECMHYALKVCPYLAQISSLSISGAVLNHLREEGAWVRDTTSIPGIPDTFIAVQAYRFKRVTSGQGTYYYVPKPAKKVEYWRGGELQPRRKAERASKHEAYQLMRKLSSQ